MALRPSTFPLTLFHPLPHPFILCPHGDPCGLHLDQKCTRLLPPRALPRVSNIVETLNNMGHTHRQTHMHRHRHRHAQTRTHTHTNTHTRTHTHTQRSREQLASMRLFVCLFVCVCVVFFSLLTESALF